MRKGFTLIELLIACFLLTAVATTTGYVLKDLLVGVPMSTRAVEVDKRLPEILRRLEMDVNSARSLALVPAGGAPADLRIVREAYTVDWQLRRDVVIRVVAGAPKTTWPIPHAAIRWRVWDRDGRDYALEVRTSVELSGDAAWRRKLAKTHVYFPGAMPGEVDQ